MVQVVQLSHVTATLHKGVEVTFLGVVPLDLGEGVHSGHGHVLHMVERGDVFRPDVGLHADDVFLFLWRQQFGQRLELIHPRHRQVPPDAGRLAGDVLALVVVEIEMRRRSHNHVMAFASSLDASFGSSPTHDDGRLGDVAFEDLVPADDTTATGFHHLGHAVHHIALEIILLGKTLVALDAQFLDLLLALGALLPANLGAFVATDMDVGRGEEVHHLVEHILDKQHGLLVTGAEHVFGDTPSAPHLVGTACAAQLGVAGQSRLHMARQVDLGNDVDVPLSSILDQVANLVLGIEAAVSDGVVEVAVMSDDRPVAIGTNRCQLRVFFDFDTPALVFA